MDKKQLNQIRYIKSEIDIIENQIDNLEPEIVTDKVTGSSPYFPYTQRSFQLEGIDVEDYKKRTRRLQNKLMKKKSMLLELQEEANNFIDNIEDSLLRQIITLKYMNGMKWQEVASIIGGNNTADSVRKIAERYLKEV